MTPTSSWTRSSNPRSFPTSIVLALASILVLAGAFVASGCSAGGSTGSSSDSAQPASRAAVEDTDTATVPDAELETPGSVAGAEAIDQAQAAAELAQREKDMELRERELELKQKELDLKEREMAQRRREARAETPRVAAPTPAPAPEPVPEPASEPAPSEPVERAAPAPEPEPQPAPQPQPVWLDVPAGRELEAQFLTRVASDTSQVGDTFRARVTEPVRTDSGEVAIPSGSEIVGRVAEVTSNDKKIGGRSRLTLEFTDLVLPSGSTVPVHASFASESESSKKKDAATIGGAAAAGAILGRLLGKGGKSAVIGAIVGGAAGTAIASNNQGEVVEIPEGWTVRLRLDQGVAVRVMR